MNILTTEQTLVSLSVIYLLTPVLVTAMIQLPKKMIASYRNECIEFLEVETEKTQPVKLFNFKSSRYKANKKELSLLFYLPFISYIMAKTRLKPRQIKKAETTLLAETIIISISITTLMEYGLSITGLCQLIFYISLVMAAFIDANSKLIPDTISLSTLWIGLLVSSNKIITIDINSAILGAFLGYTAPWIISKAVCYRAGKTDGMGYGDFKMLAMLGAWIGPMGLLNITILSSFLFLLYFGAMRAANKVTSETMIPFGPFLSIATYFICQDKLFHFSSYITSIPL